MMLLRSRLGTIIEIDLFSVRVITDDAVARDVLCWLEQNWAHFTSALFYFIFYFSISARKLGEKTTT